jgi:hypothetical protein
MQVTLKSGKKIEIAPLTLEQVDKLTDAPTDNIRAAARQSCVDAMNNADPTAPWTMETFVKGFTMADFTELGKAVMDVSGLIMGESTASR